MMLQLSNPMQIPEEALPQIDQWFKMRPERMPLVTEQYSYF